MNSPDEEVLTRCLAWLHAGQQAVLFTVLTTWGAAPRPRGALFALSRTGEPVGSVSGGCVEDDLRERVLAGEFTAAQVVRYGVTREQSLRFGLPCGGTLELLAEPLLRADSLAPALEAVRQRQQVNRILTLKSGAVSWDTPQAADPVLEHDAYRVRRLFGPAWQLLLIGAGQVAGYLAQFALALEYRVVICDPRREYAQAWQVEHTELDSGMPDEVVTARVRDPRSAVVTLTHDPKLDDMALLSALPAPAFYVGALGSRRSSEQRRERLAQLDLPAEAIARLRAPVGLPIGSHSPAEIALSVLAEITAVRNRMTQPAVPDFPG